ncbi:MAG: tryptophanase [Pseudobdellovibrionaceae bacterium]|nr:tryptophanase [Bdellovibrionales bacterium]USN48697.1 MAG: tryptophanase [Pseudobdellovibrionaceae bacterium]
METLPPTKTIFEPFKIKMVEPLPILSLKERQSVLKESFYNLFSIPAKYVTFDLLTDSGTSAMSASQWAAIMEGDESYAGSDSYFRFSETIKDITGMKHVIPTHQGRSAEALLSKAMLTPGQKVIGNTQFDTTRANIESVGCMSIDMPCKESDDSQSTFPFKGNVDLEKLEKYLKEYSDQIPFFIMTVTNNSIGGQPVSMENIRKTKNLLNQYKIPMFIDAARFAENSYFIKTREAEFSDSSVKDISKELFSYADGVLMSAKKDAFANIGGFLATNDDSLTQKVRQLMVITEGFPTYGGLCGRDLDAIAVGLKEILNEDYLSYRKRSVEYFGSGLESIGLKVVKPFGGHAVYIDAGASLPHFPIEYYPAQALSVALYEFIGLRSVEVGSVMFGRRNEETGKEEFVAKELVRLALPRRVYTQSHVDYMIEKAGHAFSNFENLPGYKIDYQPKYLRHFTAKFSQVKF